MHISGEAARVVWVAGVAGTVGTVPVVQCTGQGRYIPFSSSSLITAPSTFTLYHSKKLESVYECN